MRQTWPETGEPLAKFSNIESSLIFNRNKVIYKMLWFLEPSG